MNLKIWGLKLFLKGKLPSFVYKIAGRKAAKIAQLEDKMDTKKWYKSKGVVTGIVTLVIGLYISVDTQIGPLAGFDLPNIPEWVFTFLGAMGIYSRVVANTEITK